VTRQADGIGQTLVVGAVIIDASGRAYVQKRSSTQREFPDSWDAPCGHVEPGETMEDALAREIHEETGWTLRRIVAPVGEWTWEVEGRRHREVDFLVEVDGDLGSPRLEGDTHVEFRWVGPEDLTGLLDDGVPGNDLTYQALTKAFALAGRLRREQRAYGLPLRRSC
jgi:8-oxo-dGTP diphosphatase